MESTVAASGHLAGDQTLEAQSGKHGQPSTGVDRGGEQPRVSSVLPEGTFGGADMPTEAASAAVDVDGTLVSESGIDTSTEVLEEVELSFPSNGSEAVVDHGSLGVEKIEVSGASGGGEARAAVKAGDGGGGGEKAVVLCSAENPFLVGDFVWGKIKGHPWWPGQVCDSSDASEYAKKVRRRDQQCVLVAYFGDRTFAWCDPSQLRPFTECFEQMARQSATKNFVGSLKEALDEIQRCLEAEMSCTCVSAAAALASVPSRWAANAGIKEGASVPNGCLKELSIVDRAPAELLGRLHDIACDVSVTALMEIVAIKAWFSAFNRWKGWHAGFPSEHQEDEVEAIVDVKASVGPPKKGSARSSHRKKVRSMAELIAETDMEVEMVEDSIEKDKEEAVEEKPAAARTPRQRKKDGEAKPSDGGSSEAGFEEGTGWGRRERKRSKYLSPPYTTLLGGRVGHLPISPKDVEEATHPKKSAEASPAAESPGSGKAGCPSPTTPKSSTEATREKSAARFVGDGPPVDEMLSELRAAALNPMYLKGNRSSSKVRVFFDRFRSYLYANVSDYGKEELKAKENVREKKPPVEGPGGSMELEGKCVMETKPPVQGPDGSMDLGVKSVKETKPSEVQGPPDGSMELEGISGPVMEKETPVRSPRSPGRKPTTERKRSSPGADANGGKAAKSRGKRKSAGQEGGSPGQSKRELKRKKEGEVINGDAGAALVLTFAAGATLPSKEDLISAFGQFGPLSEPETELLRDSGCARVVFARSSDAEKVFKCSEGGVALGPGVAGCRLQYLHDTNLSLAPLPAACQKPPLQFVQKSLESMISALRESSSPPREVAGPSEALKPEARENLVDEMDGLLKKVNKMLTGSAAGAT